VSGRSSSPSIVSNGELAGKDLFSLVKEYGRLIVGKRAKTADSFPLLFKLIDAKKRLSVQVHPNEKTAPVTKGEPKTEMWRVLEDPANKGEVSIYAGLQEGVKAEEIEKAISSGKFEDIIVEHKARPGDTFFIPGGLVHAIGDNALIYEVQQSSDTTYRLYDWGRVGANGKPRSLHIKESVETIDYSLGVPDKTDCVSCEFFNFKSVELNGDIEIDTKGESFTVLFVASGEVELKWATETLTVKKGSSVLIPASVSAIISGIAECFITTL
jgi:mannose-6-phosphate isomerase